MNQLSVTELVKLQNAYSTILNESHEYTSEFGYSHDEDYDEANRPYDEFQKMVMRSASSPEFEDYIYKVTFDKDITIVEFNDECGDSVFGEFFGRINDIIDKYDFEWKLVKLNRKGDYKFLKYRKASFEPDYSGKYSDKDWEDAVQAYESFDFGDVEANKLNDKLNGALEDILDNEICYEYPGLEDRYVGALIEYILEDAKYIPDDIVNDLGICNERDLKKYIHDNLEKWYDDFCEYIEEQERDEKYRRDYEDDTFYNHQW